TPRIVTPAGFPEQFTAQEQAAILAHEHVHLARQDARINALAAFLRCLCWFNPLIHLGARWLRVDQELACDATSVAAGISRRDYAQALLKSQLVVTALPLGCNWPGAQHPLIERIALLKRKPPGTARRLAGASLVLLAATLAGLSAWAAQPSVAAKAVAARPHMVLAALPAAAPDQTAQEPVANANPAGGDNDADVSNSVSASKVTPATPAPVRVEAPRGASIAALTGTILAAPPQIASGIASLNAANQPTARTSPDASPKPSDTSTGPPLTTFASGAPSVAAATPRSETELALECYLGFGATRCKKNDCDPVGRVDYLGTNAAGADLYEVQFMHHNRAYVIAPNPDGKIGHYLIKSADPYWIKQTVSSRAAQGLIYTRPENSPVVSACPTSGPHIDEYG
ncbi:MAG TPA: M56 family metallopeptidase, partial [Rhizomicrobium sp.]|nr:M56 family metallopeptidase [Rhizomicrobium sp.]